MRKHVRLLTTGSVAPRVAQDEESGCKWQDVADDLFGFLTEKKGEDTEDPV